MVRQGVWSRGDALKSRLSFEALAESGFHFLASVFGEGGCTRRIPALIEECQAILAGVADGVQLLLELPTGRADPPVSPGA